MIHQPEKYHDNIRLREITRFARGLRAALYDTECERRGPVHYYFDADVVIKVILGFLQFEDNSGEARDVGEGRDPREYLVQALLSLGMLGKIRILRPHALEIDEKLRYKLDYRTAMTKGLLATQTRAFVDQWGLKEALTRLEHIKASSTSQDQKRRAILETLRRRGPRTFVAMALIRGGTWKTRLRQLWDRKMLVFEGSSPDVRVLVKTHELDEILGAITHHRGSEHDLNNLRDAAVLTAVSLMLRQGQQVRFYTDTKAIRDVVSSNAVVRDLLTEWPSPTGGVQHATTIICDTDYFLIRSNFSALSFTDPVTDGVVAREDLQWLSDELGGILDAQPDEAIRIAARIRWGGRYLSEIIRQLNTLGFLRNVLSQAGPDVIATDVDDWVRLWEYVEGLRGDDMLAGEIRDVKTALGEYVAQMREWVADYHELQRGAHELYSRSNPALNPDPMRDLGMIRWNVTLSPSESDTVRVLIKQLMGSDEDTRSQAALTLAAMVEDAPGAERNVIQVVSLLWTLNMFALTVRVLRAHIDTLRGEHRDIPAGILILHAAAMLRGGMPESPYGVHKLVQEAVVAATGAQASEPGIMVGSGLFTTMRHSGYKR
ncbi:MAG: hypothetical protein JO093_09645 [Acidobacteria bacterium]|nr:hypothetical protein [Acidobacteriota bacterium]